MAAIEYHTKQALIGKALGAGARMLGRGAREFGQGFSAPIVQDLGGISKAITGAGMRKFGPGGMWGKAYNATKGLPMKGMRWEFGNSSIPRFAGNALGNLSIYGSVPALAATAMGGDQAQGAALAMAQMRQRYDQVPWYQKVFGGTRPLDNIMRESDPRIIAELNKLYAR